MPRVNQFITDDVGLGKTIEAGLILRELLLRRRAETCVIAAPPGMLIQWQEEMEARFGLSFNIVDRDYAAAVRRRRGYAAHPWRTGSRFLVSHRLLADPAYRDGLVGWLGEFKAKSVLILDEAHHAAPASGSRYAIDSAFTHAIRGIAGRFGLLKGFGLRVHTGATGEAIHGPDHLSVRGGGGQIAAEPPILWGRPGRNKKWFGLDQRETGPQLGKEARLPSRNPDKRPVSPN